MNLLFCVRVCGSYVMLLFLHPLNIVLCFFIALWPTMSVPIVLSSTGINYTLWSIVKRIWNLLELPCRLARQHNSKWFANHNSNKWRWVFISKNLINIFFRTSKLCEKLHLKTLYLLAIEQVMPSLSIFSVGRCETDAIDKHTTVHKFREFSQQSTDISSHHLYVRWRITGGLV